MLKVHVPLLNDEYSMLHQMASQELRLPEQMVRWLIRQEAEKRGLTVEVQQTFRNDKSTVPTFQAKDSAFVGVTQ